MYIQLNKYDISYIRNKQYSDYTTTANQYTSFGTHLINLKYCHANGTRVCTEETGVFHFHQLTIKSAFFPIRILAFFFIWSFSAALGAFFDMFWLLESVSLRIWRSKVKLASVCVYCIQKTARFTTGSWWWRRKSSMAPLASTCFVRVYMDQREKL